MKSGIRPNSAIYCSALFCCESVAEGGTSQVSFHPFPSNVSLLSKWLKNLNRKCYTPTSSSKLCSQHFTPQSFVPKTQQLKRNAVPTLFFSNGPKVAKRAYRLPNQKPVCMTLENQAHCNDSGMVIELCDPPETTQVFSDEEDDYQRQWEPEIVHDELEFISDDVSICRTCGLPTRDSTDIFSQEGIKQHLQYKINTNLPIKVGMDDSLPTLICRTCLERLQACHLIRESSRRADVQLKASMAIRKVLVNYCPDIETPASELVQQMKQKLSSIADQNSELASQPIDLFSPQFIDISSPSPGSECGDVCATSPASDQNCIPAPVTEQNYTNFSSEFGFASTSSPRLEWDQVGATSPISDQNSTTPPVFEQDYKNISPVQAVITIDCDLQVMSRQTPSPQFQDAFSQRQGSNICTESNNSKVAQSQVLGAAIVLAGIGCEPQQRKKQKDKRKSSNQVVGKTVKKRKTVKPQPIDDIIQFQDTSGMSCKDLTDLQEKLQDDIKKLEEDMQEKEQSFTCSQCSSSFTAEHLYNVHLMHHRIENRRLIYTCCICKLKFWSAYLLAEHKKSSHYLAKTFLCEPCNKTFKRKDVYQAHLNNIHSTKRYNCQLCLKKFAVIYDLKCHLKYHDRTKCDKCGRFFKTVEGMKAHQMHQTSPCSELKDSADTPRLPTTLTEGPASCPECGDQFYTHAFMRRHLTLKHRNSPHIRLLNCTIKKKSFLCGVCKQLFTSKTYLATHMNVHTKAELYRCPHCDKTSYHKSSLLVHIKTHSDIRPYACTYCDNKFKRRDALNMHIRIHTGEKPNVCQYCSKGFIQAGDLKLHVKRHLGESTSRKRKKTNATIVS